MTKPIVYRALVFDDDQAIRSWLWDILKLRGYEIFAFPHPGLCPQFEMKACPCPRKQSCTDIIISDLNMPVSKGSDFIEAQIKKGCQCEHIALMSGQWKEQDASKAQQLGCKIFYKPFQLGELTKWFDEVEKNINPSRKLSDWWKEQYRPMEGSRYI